MSFEPQNCSSRCVAQCVAHSVAYSVAQFAAVSVRCAIQNQILGTAQNGK